MPRMWSAVYPAVTMNPLDLDPPTHALLAVLADAGYVVGVGRDGDAAVVTATDPSGESWTVRGPDAYAALCELAGQADPRFWLASGALPHETIRP